MATIRVSCPMCGQLVEVDAQYAGQEVECGACLQVFVAEPPKAASTWEARASDPPPGLRGRPRRRDEDDDYEHDHEDLDEFDHGPPFRAGVASGTAVVALFVGVLALLTSCCPLTGVALGAMAMVLGSKARKAWGGSGAATAATVLGSLACLISIGFVAWLIAFGMRGGGN